MALPLPLFPRVLPALRRLPLRRIACLLPPALVAAWVAYNWPLFADGVAQLRTAHPGWLLAAVAVMCACWLPVCLVRQGVVLERLPAGRLLASQVAAGAANHLLPAGLGAHVVTLRFLRGCGIPLERSAAALALYSLAEPMARLCLLVLLIVAAPDALRLGEVAPDAGLLALAAGAVALAAAGLLAVPPIRRLLLRFLRTALTDARALHRRPARVLALWGGAFAFPAFQAAVLVAVALALHAQLPVLHVMLAYVAASIAAGLVPAPGGIGSVEAALAVALVTAGATAATATATVIGFRLITVWLPLLPGALVLYALIRRKVL
ncbi:lysylphosphatidylglycerol synthase domain-containing protein [Streptomyces boninensis]|uniref:lysylphosphatidylglycerol synthase domain-containing protein n=1 Tax=Streptomyces boninensis TaxID=2039455 RepID=UPI003B20C6A0